MQITATQKKETLEIDHKLIARLDDRLNEAMKKSRKPALHAVNELGAPHNHHSPHSHGSLHNHRSLHNNVLEIGEFSHRRQLKAAIIAQTLMHVWFGRTLIFARNKV